MFPGNPLSPMPSSSTPAQQKCQAFRHPCTVPLNAEEKDLAQSAAFSRFNDSALVPAVYASCRPHGRRRKTRFGVVASL